MSRTFGGCDSVSIVRATAGLRRNAGSFARSSRSAIRSGYPVELINSEENLLLLSGTHHKAIDTHASVYRVDELLDWKRRQVAEARGWRNT
jgi:hypothetical protein